MKKCALAKLRVAKATGGGKPHPNVEPWVARLAVGLTGDAPSDLPSNPRGPT